MSDGIKVKCGNCGRVSMQKELEKEISFGSCDLDTRPAAPARYSIGDEIQVCPHCGYVHTSLEEKIRGSKDVVVSEDYLNLGKQGYPEAVEYYFKAAYLIKDDEEKFYHYLSAAWVFDDKGEDEKAIMARNMAIEIGSKMKDTSTDFKLIMIDLYRKTKQFKEALEWCDMIGDNVSNTFKAMAKFQRKLIKKKDLLTYNMKEALEYEGK